MSHKRKEMLTTSGERKRHFPKWLKRSFWKGERVAEQAMLRNPDESRRLCRGDRAGHFGGAHER